MQREAKPSVSPQGSPFIALAPSLQDLEHEYQPLCCSSIGHCSLSPCSAQHPRLGTECVRGTHFYSTCSASSSVICTKGKPSLQGHPSSFPPDGTPQSLLPAVRLSDLLGNPFMQKKKKGADASSQRQLHFSRAGKEIRQRLGSPKLKTCP